MLATEPGITERTRLYFLYSQLPGTLFFGDQNRAMAFNYALAFLLGGVLWFIAARRSRRNATQRSLDTSGRVLAMFLDITQAAAERGKGIDIIALDIFVG